MAGINQSLRIHNFSQQIASVPAAAADTSSVGTNEPPTLPRKAGSEKPQMEANQMRKLIPVVGPLLAAVVAMVPIVGAILAGVLA